MRVGINLLRPNYFILLVMGCLISLFLAHVLWLFISWHIRSRIFRRLSSRYHLRYFETRLPLSKIIAVDPIKGDGPFIWRELTGIINGTAVAICDIEPRGMTPHFWWYRDATLSTNPDRGVLSITRASVGGQDTYLIPKLYHFFPNRFANEMQIEQVLKSINATAILA